MKLPIRMFALSLAIAGTFTGTTAPRASAIPSIVTNAAPGPLPLCNPLAQDCPNIR
ncbi:hypothetical protein [Acidicapsa ligni]|uniref:hypothetical protein n=1 Tax=Acidicapsa ligni TaxID=542300 RepID=UPI0021E056A7|nr:hypothetical protein [Acidicapsa ligni]